MLFLTVCPNGCVFCDSVSKQLCPFWLCVQKIVSFVIMCPNGCVICDYVSKRLCHLSLCSWNATSLVTMCPNVCVPCNYIFKCDSQSKWWYNLWLCVLLVTESLHCSVISDWNHDNVVSVTICPNDVYILLYYCNKKKINQFFYWLTILNGSWRHVIERLPRLDTVHTSHCLHVIQFRVMIT